MNLKRHSSGSLWRFSSGALLLSALASPPLCRAESRDIAAAGEAWVRFRADTGTVTMLIEERGPTAQGVDSALLERTKRLEAALKEKGFQGTDRLLYVRGTTFSDPSNADGTISPASSTLKGQRLIAATISDVDKVPLFVDTAVKAGANSVIEIKQVQRTNDDLVKSGHTQALQRARSNAEVIAQSLNVKLGRLLTASVSQEREEDLVEREREEGPTPAGATDQEIRFTASVRYEIAAQD